MFENLQNNLIKIREKKIEINFIGKIINDLKKKIDDLKENLKKKNYFNEKIKENENIVDEEEMKFLNEIKNIKQEYNKNYEKRNEIKYEVDYLTKISDNNRIKLIKNFEEWFKKKFEKVEKEENNFLKKKKEVDNEEKFEKLENDIKSHNNDNSLPFYNAIKKNLKNKTIKKNL
jgi:hypothetical protein